MQNVAILRRSAGSSTTVVFLGNVSASERQGDCVSRDKRHDVHRRDGQHCGHSLYHAKQINVTELLTSTLNAMRIAIISVHFVTVPCDSVRAFVCCHRQLPYTTYHIISTTYGRLILRRTYNLITITDLIIFLIICNFFLICYRHLQEPSAVAFFF